MNAYLEREFAAAQRGRNLALVIFGFGDLDEFGERLGTAAADAAVVEFARVLERMTRRMNMSARCGWRADAFLSVLSDADAYAAHTFVKRVREATEKLSLPLPNVDVGIAVYQPHVRSPGELVEQAERALAVARADHDAWAGTGRARPETTPHRPLAGLGVTA